MIFTLSYQCVYTFRLQNTSSPVWVIASSINCLRVDSCFDTCYRDPVNRNDLSSACGNNFIYLNCGKFLLVYLSIHGWVTCVHRIHLYI